MSMNEDLPVKDESAPSGKIIVLAVASFYIIAVINFVEFLVRWFVLFWFVFVILEDYTESVEKDRTSILEMLMPGTKTKAFDQVMKERLSQWDRIKRLFYYQLKLQRGSNCDVCMELFVEGEGTVQMECNSQHILHYECLCEWLDEGHTRCPVCSTEINIVATNKSLKSTTIQP